MHQFVRIKQSTVVILYIN